ncbi:MAG: hypothetical protein C0615_09465 [Desulfuromonas sp.]|nr:MAG: hypothetical protein C0615_09465 [Desulfuromonas sp.]
MVWPNIVTMDIWLNITTILTVFTLAIISPGPNFILVANTALFRSRREGLYTAFGVATGSALFGLAGMVGLLIIFVRFPYFADLIRLVGGIYLTWLGLQMVRSGLRRQSEVESRSLESLDFIPFAAWRTGLLTNLGNPKAWAFYLSLFTVVMTPGFLLWQKAMVNGSMFLISFAWYGLVAILVSDRNLQSRLRRVQASVQLLFGIMLSGLGVYLFINW